MSLHPATELAKAQEFGIVDRSHRLEQGVEERRGVSFGEHQVVSARVVGLAGVVAEVAARQHGDDVRRRHRRGRMSRVGGTGAAHTVDTQLSGQCGGLV